MKSCATPVEDIADVMARENDARLMAYQKSVNALARRLSTSTGILHRLLGTQPDRMAFSTSTWRFWERAVDDLLESARIAEVPHSVRRQINAAMTQVAADRVHLARQRLRVVNLESIFNDHGGWWRYHRVAGGPLHLTTECPVLVLSARTAPVVVPELSATEPEAIASTVSDPAQLCAICFQRKTIERMRLDFQDRRRPLLFAG